LLPRTGIDPMPLAFKATTLALKASSIEPVPLAFKASGISSAPLALYYTIMVSRIWPGSWMRINPLYLSSISPSTACSLMKKNPPHDPCITALSLRNVKPNGLE